MSSMDATQDGGFEQIVERGDVPIARAASPLWKWAFIGTMVTLGAGALAAVIYAELSDPAPVEGNGILLPNTGQRFGTRC